MKNNQMIITVVVIVAVGIAGFFGGMKYQESKNPPRNSNRQLQGNRQGASGAIIGQIFSIDDNKSITVKMQDGSSKIVLLSNSVTVSKTDAVSRDDLKVGVSVGVFGTNNPDGSVTASNIQLNPMFRMGRGAK